ncbi:MAG: hypothetical protein M3R24_03505 [Chloroflexota bacterium]|nr:hypothetical protein [Chloroflexota bacterium]PLS79449.1 MAG: hypothetical protein CYG59_13315 [Chloroflexota bacterium]
MMDRLNQFFGQDNTRHQDYEDFARRYDNDPTQITEAEAARRYRELVAQGQIDDNDLDEAHEQSFSRLPEQERRQLAQRFQSATQDPNRAYQGFPQGMDLDEAAQPRNLGRMTRRAGEQDPDLLEQLVGPNSGLNSTGAKLAMAGAAAFLASKYLGGRR